MLIVAPPALNTRVTKRGGGSVSEWINTDEQIATHVTDSHAASDPGVYAVEIGVPESAGYETLSRDWLKHYDNTPPYLGRIVDADTVIYVGASKSVRDRIDEHREGKVRKATLPRLWGITDVVDVWWYNDVSRAFERENYHALELSKSTPTSTYVHSR